jgi:hypothetical protein
MQNLLAVDSPYVENRQGGKAGKHRRQGRRTARVDAIQAAAEWIGQVRQLGPSARPDVWLEVKRGVKGSTTRSEGMKEGRKSLSSLSSSSLEDGYANAVRFQVDREWRNGFSDSCSGTLPLRLHAEMAVLPTEADVGVCAFLTSHLSLSLSL